MKALEILEKLESDVQEMRESGDTDLRMVIGLIRAAKKEVEPHE
ncbi:hypothetical protein [Paenibacillus psychroresistens]|nr:hypothetical protein [Paenibacillus psychroresistens]